MPGARDPPPAPPSHPCEATSAADRRALAESAYALSEPACNVVFRPLVRRLRKNLFRLVELNHLAQQEEARKLCHAGRLLHVVSHNYDGIPLLELEDQLFDLSSRNRVEGRARLVH